METTYSDITMEDVILDIATTSELHQFGRFGRITEKGALVSLWNVVFGFAGTSLAVGNCLVEQGDVFVDDVWVSDCL